MNVVDVLTQVLHVTAILSWVVTAILIYGAVQRPFITALIFFTVLSFLVSLGLTAFVWAIDNAALNYPTPKEIVQIVLRLVFVGLFAFQVLFLVAYRLRWFRDGAK